MARSKTQNLRLLLAGALVFAAAASIWVLLGAANSALALWRELRDLPVWLATAVGAVFGVLMLGSGWLGWRLLRPRPRVLKPAVPLERDKVEQRVIALAELNADAHGLAQELIELDHRHTEGTCYVALFGEISAGKSSLVHAIVPAATPEVDVLGGTTAYVTHYRGKLPNGRELVLADVPGSGEIGGREREVIARDEALRAHVVVYIADAELTRRQDEELRWLDGYGKPLLLTVNKADQWDDAERILLLDSLRQRYHDVVDAVVAVSAGGSERFERVLADGRREQVVRERRPDIREFARLLQHLTDGGSAALEPAREQAILGGLSERIGRAEQAARSTAADRIVDKYTRRAIVGALAAVAPGSDLVIQGALAAGLVRELAALYSVPIKTLDLDAFLERAALTVRTATTVVLAIAGNAAKAFPGFGTLGGGVLHAVAYGLIFDSLGRAVAATLAEQQRFDQECATDSLRELLANDTTERLRRLAGIALDATRGKGTD